MMFEESTFYIFLSTTQIQELHIMTHPMYSSLGCFTCNWLVWIVVVPSFRSPNRLARATPCTISGDEATLHRGSWRMPR